MLTDSKFLRKVINPTVLVEINNVDELAAAGRAERPGWAEIEFDAWTEAKL